VQSDEDVENTAAAVAPVWMKDGTI